MHGEWASQLLPTLHDNEFAGCWEEVENIALEPEILLPSRGSPEVFAGISATFPQLRKISIVVSPVVDLERAFSGKAVVSAQTRRCRLSEAVGDTSWPGRLPRRHWLDTIREEVQQLQAPDHAISFSVQSFETYVGQQGRVQWKQHVL